MKPCDVDNMLVMFDHSLDILIDHLDCGKPEEARKSAFRMKRSIHKIKTVESSCIPPQGHPPQGAMV